MSDDARLKAFVDKEATRRRNGAIITLVVGLLLAAVIAIYLGVLFSKLMPFLEPEELVNTGFGMIEPHVPELISQASAYATDAVPMLITRGKEEIIQRAPDLRGKVEEIVTEQAGKILALLGETLSEHVSDIIAQHKPDLDALLADYGNPDQQQKTREELEHAFEEVARKELDAHLPDWMEGLRDVHEELKVLTKAEGLTEEQRLMRELVILTKECRRFFPKELPKLEWLPEK